MYHVTVVSFSPHSRNRRLLVRNKRRSGLEGLFHHEVDFWFPVIHQHLYDDFAQTDAPNVQDQDPKLV
jgi:hypothetical protein